MSINNPSQRQKTVFSSCKFVNGGFEYDSDIIYNVNTIEWAIDNRLAVIVDSHLVHGTRMRLTKAGEEFRIKITLPAIARTTNLPSFKNLSIANE